MCSVPFANLEFYNTPDGDIMLKEVGKPARPFREADRDIISELLAIIRDRYPKAHAALMELYSKSTTGLSDATSVNMTNTDWTSTIGDNCSLKRFAARFGANAGTRG